MMQSSTLSKVSRLSKLMAWQLKAMKVCMKPITKGRIFLLRTSGWLLAKFISCKPSLIPLVRVNYKATAHTNLTINTEMNLEEPST